MTTRRPPSKIKPMDGNVSLKQIISRHRHDGSESSGLVLDEEFEQFFTYLFNSSRDGISVLDTDFTILGVNSVMERWYSGFETISGRKCYQVYHNRKEPCADCPTIQALEQKRYSTSIVPYEDAAGVHGTQELCAFPVFDDNNNVCAIIEYVRDITEILKEEAVIKNLKKRLRFQEQTLQEQEIALNVLIKNREREEQRIVGKVIGQLTQQIHPLIETLKVRLEGREEYLFVETLEAYLRDAFSSASGRQGDGQANLSGREREVADLIRQGKTTKEIAVLLGVSPKAVDYHRMNIRKKLNISNRKINLQTYLSESRDAG